jgi:VWFA-related protein
MGLRKTTSLGGAIAIAIGAPIFLGFSDARAQDVTAGLASQLVLRSQTGPTASPAPPTTTRLVRVSVVVGDAHGNPMLGLAPEDFTIFDDGRPQAIQHFATATNQPIDHYTPAHVPDTYSNRIEDRARIPDSATVILLDGLNTRFEDQVYARRQTLKYLQQIQPQEYVAVYTLEHELRALQDFTTDATGLLAALQAYRSETALVADESEPRERLGYRIQAPQRADDLLESFLTVGSQSNPSSERQNQEHLTAAALLAIANHLASLPGRKSIVWVSGSFPASLTFTKLEQSVTGAKSATTQEIELALRTLNDAGIAVYPVNAQGLMPPEETLLTLSSSTTAHRAPKEANAVNLETMNRLADLTGGESFLRADSIFASIRAAMDDSLLSYELSYYADGSASDDSFHSINVSVRRIGVKVRARAGYFAMPIPNLTPQARKALLADIATSPLDATMIGLRVRVKAANLPGSQMLNARVEFQPQEISFTENNAQRIAKVDAVFIQLDGKNRIVDAIDETIDLDFSPARLQQALKSGISYSKDIPIQPDASALRVILRDAPTSTVGSVSIPLLQYFPRVNEIN